MRRALLTLDGVLQVTIDLATGSVIVESESPVPTQVLADTINKAGYQVV